MGEKMKNKLLPFLLLLCCSVTAVSGCGNEKKSEKDSSSSISNSVEQNTAADNKVENEKADITNLSINESHTTVEGLQDVVYKMLENVILFNDKVTFPSSFDDFDDNYTAANAIPYEDYDMSTYTLYYKDTNIGFIDLSKDNDIRGLYIDDDVSNNDFNICGIGYDSSKDDVIKAFGEPSEQSETSYIYGNSESVCINFGFNGEKIRSIKIFYF